MNYSIIQTANKDVWDQFLFDNKGSFLQSFEWGEFQKKLGKNVWRLSVGENDLILAQAQIIKERFPLAGKSWLYLPFGPCFKQSLSGEGKKQVLEILLAEVKKIAKKENAVYCYFEPLSELSSLPNRSELSSLLTPVKRVQPRKTLVLDLTQSEEAIFQGFQHKTTRYNIRFAENKGVKITEAEPTQKNTDIFYNLLQKTSQRDGFRHYPKEYFTKLFSSTGDGPLRARRGPSPVRLFFAEWQENVIAASVLVFFGERATYLHAASDYQHRNLMAPYLLQWKQILFAKQMGCVAYDFWGIDEKKWPGITYFKKSFGGKEVEYPEGADVAYRKCWYRIYKVARRLLR